MHDLKAWTRRRHPFLVVGLQTCKNAAASLAAWLTLQPFRIPTVHLFLCTNGPRKHNEHHLNFRNRSTHGREHGGTQHPVQPTVYTGNSIIQWFSDHPHVRYQLAFAPAQILKAFIHRKCFSRWFAGPSKSILSQVSLIELVGGWIGGLGFRTPGSCISGKSETRPNFRTTKGKLTLQGPEVGLG